VRDAAVARDFYRDVLGFRVAAEQQRGRFIWLELGMLEVLLRTSQSAPARPQAYGSASSALVLYTDGLAATKEALVVRGLEFRGTDGSPACLTFTDLDGHWFQLVDPEHP